MTPRATILQIARMVRDDIRSGEVSPGAHGFGEAIRVGNSWDGYYGRYVQSRRRW